MDSIMDNIKQIENCEHLFLKEKDKEEYYGFHSSDCGSTPPIVVCLKCGLTNKHLEMDSITKRRCDIRLFSMNKDLYRVINKYDEEFKRLYSKGYRRSGKSFDETVLPLISDEVLHLKNPHQVYEMAKEAKPNATNEEIFEEMKRINETSKKEKIKVLSIEK